MIFLIFENFNGKSINDIIDEYIKTDDEYLISDGKNKFYIKNKLLHRLDGPAIIGNIEEGDFFEEWFSDKKHHRKEYTRNREEWWVEGKRHRSNGPAVKWSDGAEEWWLNGQLHRIDEPAVIENNGTKKWYKSGKLNRENGPAIEYNNGDKEWWVDGKRHRFSGPAIIKNNIKAYYIEGEEYSEKNFKLFKVHKDKEKTSYYFCNLLHRLDGPAIVYENGDKRWYKYGLLHRVGGPAVISDDKEEWWVDGKSHQENVPAVKSSYGNKHWYIDGERHCDEGTTIEQFDSDNEW